MVFSFCDGGPLATFTLGRSEDPILDMAGRDFLGNEFTGCLGREAVPRDHALESPADVVILSGGRRLRRCSRCLGLVGGAAIAGSRAAEASASG